MRSPLRKSFHDVYIRHEVAQQNFACPVKKVQKIKCGIEKVKEMKVCSGDEDIVMLPLLLTSDTFLISF